MIRTVETSIDTYKVEIPSTLLAGGRISGGRFGQIKITYGDPGFPSCVGFSAQYWGMGQCGHLMLFDLYCGIEDDELYTAVFDLFKVESDGYFARAGLVSFLTYYEQSKLPKGLTRFLVSQQNCKPVHTWRNQAHSPYSQLGLYVWHRNTKGVPEKWGIPDDIEIDNDL